MSRPRNPYRPGVGLQPPYLAGRDAEQARFQRILRAAPEIPGNVRVTGLRGVGKTVLLKRFQDLAEEEGWATVALELQPRQNAESHLNSALQAQFDALKSKLSRQEAVKRAVVTTGGTIRRAVSVEWEGVTWSLAGDLESKTAELGQIIVDAGQFVVDHARRGVVILLDEAQILTDASDSHSGNHALSTLVAAMSSIQRTGLPVCLVMCGLPTLAVNLLRARTYSERMFQGVLVGSLPTEAARDAFVEPLQTGPVMADKGLIDSVLQEVDGYPYFIQLWGAELWDATFDAGQAYMTDVILDAIRDQILLRLDLDFYEPRVASLTPAEQDLLSDSSKCSYPPLLVSELNGHSPKSAGNVNVLLGRLVTANVLFRPRKGQYEYTAPGFKDFLQRR